MTETPQWQKDFTELSEEQQTEVIWLIQHLKTHSKKSTSPPSQGDIFWAHTEMHRPNQKAISHPHVILQDDIFNHSRLNTFVACALSSNPKRITEPGNIALEIGEANLKKRSIVIVSQLSTLSYFQLGEYIGTLSTQRVQQILKRIRFQQRSFFKR